MSTSPTPYSGDQGDENDSGLDECKQDIESLEQRMAVVEQKLGIPSPQDEKDAPDALMGMIQRNAPMGAGK